MKNHFHIFMNWHL